MQFSRLSSDGNRFLLSSMYYSSYLIQILFQFIYILSSFIYKDNFLFLHNCKVYRLDSALIYYISLLNYQSLSYLFSIISFGYSESFQRIPNNYLGLTASSRMYYGCSESNFIQPSIIQSSPILFAHYYQYSRYHSLVQNFCKSCISYP